MPEYTYIDDYEREWTQKYEGAYTPEEIELNKKLKEECYKDSVDFAVVEELLLMSWIRKARSSLQLPTDILLDTCQRQCWFISSIASYFLKKEKICR